MRYWFVIFGSILSLASCGLSDNSLVSESQNVNQSSSQEVRATNDYGVISVWISDVTFLDSASRLNIDISYTLSSGAVSRKRDRVHFVLRNIPIEGFSIRSFDPRKAEWSSWHGLQAYVANKSVNTNPAIDDSGDETAKYKSVEYSPDFLYRIDIGHNYELRRLRFSLALEESLDRYQAVAQISFNENAKKFIDEVDWLLTDTDPGFRSVKLIDEPSFVTIEP